MRLALQVAVLRTSDYTQAEIARLLDAAPADIRAAHKRIEKVARSLDRDSDF